VNPSLEVASNAHIKDCCLSDIFAKTTILPALQKERKQQLETQMDTNLTLVDNLICKYY
jgi:hypothetical protein